MQNGHRRRLPPAQQAELFPVDLFRVEPVWTFCGMFHYIRLGPCPESGNRGQFFSPALSHTYELPRSAFILDAQQNRNSFSSWPGSHCTDDTAALVHLWRFEALWSKLSDIRDVLTRKSVFKLIWQVNHGMDSFLGTESYKMHHMKAHNTVQCVTSENMAIKHETFAISNFS